MSSISSAINADTLSARVIRASDVEGVDALRIASYRRATWFTLRNAERIRCALDQPHSRVTAVFERTADGEVPVATICQTLARDRAEAEAMLELEAPVAANDFPALVISRAATAEDHAGLRLNHVLRWFTLHAVIRDGIAAILGGHAQGTPNLRVMAELGYRFVDVAHSTMSQVDVNTRHVMSYLPAGNFVPALARLEPMIAHALPRIEWAGPRLSFAEWLAPVTAQAAE
ncbi:MAG TPA: hypothetical protein VFR86_08600 [Burkholderiaceae bacterium]|nr:hypothetical protein [Burkholderiaceae bacterium]